MVVSHRIRQDLRPGTDVLAQGTAVAVRKFGSLRCSDTRDNLYGFLGIVNEYARARAKADHTQDVRFALYQALKMGIHEICTEETGLAIIQRKLYTIKPISQLALPRRSRSGIFSGAMQRSGYTLTSNSLIRSAEPSESVRKAVLPRRPCGTTYTWHTDQ
ncbi:hypothetical protein F4775DRAFT_591279 [Biscogniauxia sp. FL1348]|nr:hypothetical protein F4775DRAFT_591279 [Biscogniauxia sp. FL1348]